MDQETRKVNAKKATTGLLFIQSRVDENISILSTWLSSLRTTTKARMHGLFFRQPKHSHQKESQCCAKDGTPDCDQDGLLDSSHHKFSADCHTNPGHTQYYKSDSRSSD